MKTINIESWNRKEHFEFFSSFEEPYFGIVSDVECTRAYNISKAKKTSFFAYYLYKSLKAINQIEEFRSRVVEDKVVIFDAIHASATIGREDGTFGFSFVPFDSDFDKFNASLNSEIERVRNSDGLGATKDTLRQDVVHFSAVPWIKFTGLTHARKFQTSDSVPKVSFGKTYEVGEKIFMAVSINGHHGLLDGLHVGRYFDLFQEYLNGK